MLRAVFLLAAGSLFGQSLDVSQRQARQSRDWVDNGIIYQVWMRSFTPEATLKAATARLEYVAQLGATIIYLSPVQKMSEVGGFTNPYRISNYDEVDPQYGSEADLKAFVAEAHRLGLKVLMDVVYYHTGPDSVLIKNPGYHLRTPGGELQKGTWGLPRLNFANTELRKYLAGNLVHWVKDVDADGFRCDVSAGIPLDFWEEAREALDKVKPDLFLLAESDFPPEQLKAFDASYNFSWYETLAAVIRDGEPATRIKEQWTSMRAKFPRGARLLRLSDNHDRERADVMFGQKGALATAVLNFTLDGIPFVYNGQEAGARNATSHNQKTPIDWSLARRPQPMGLYKRLIELRRTEAALQSGDVVWVDNSAPESVVSYRRVSGQDEILVVVNLSNRKVEPALALLVSDYTPIEDLLGKKRSGFAMAPGQPVVKLGGFEFAVYKRAKPEAAGR